ncbi:MAG: nucleotide exchange factor GrpE, partial [Clostridia bacterium]|nr:nucleotide exchange factor GrpE [Clostridia bacterium]
MIKNDGFEEEQIKSLEDELDDDIAEASAATKAEKPVADNGKAAESGKTADNGKNAEGGKLAEELKKAQTLAEDYKRKWYAVTAEYDNFRKRNLAATSAAYQDGKAEAIIKLLPVADTFGYAYESASDEKTRAGIDKIVKNFINILGTLGVELIDVKVGDAFDESVMEAVMTLPCEGDEKPNTVKAILKHGYRREDKV